MELRTLGWPVTLKKRKPEAGKKSVTTVGDFIDAVSSQYVGQNRTIEDYGRNFRSWLLTYSISNGRLKRNTTMSTAAG
jgi:hypothetical protein